MFVSFEMQATVSKCDFGNAPGEIRTHGPRIRNPVLYPTELRGRIVFSAFRFTSSALQRSISSYLSGVQSQQKVNTTAVTDAEPDMFTYESECGTGIANPVPGKKYL
jgi:hypothetical protein